MAKYISQQAIRRQKKRFWRKIILSSIALFFLLFLSSWLSRLDRFQISNVSIYGNSAIKEKEILNIINENIVGNYFWLFSKSNFLIYPKNVIKKELLDSFAQIKELKIKFDNFQSIIVEMTERVPYALWCQEKENDCYFMDKTAYLYAEAPLFLNNSYFKYTGGLLSISTSSPVSEIFRQTYLSQEKEGHFEEVDLFIRLLKDINLDGYKLIIKDNNDYELFFNNGSKLIFDGNQDFDEIFKDLQAVLIDLGDLEGKEFEYIDLRFDHKVLYKFKEV